MVGRGDLEDSKSDHRKSQKPILEDKPQVRCEVATFGNGGITDRQRNGGQLLVEGNSEIQKVMVAFEFDKGLTPEQVRQDKTPYVAFQEITCHMIFDVKMDLTRKARFVAGGHWTEPPASITYSSVVSHDSVRLAFLIAALNNIEIIACDVGNAHLNAGLLRIWI